MTDQDTAKKIERANSYRMMMDNWAWKDFKNMLKDIKQNALEGAIYASTMDDVHLHRGRVKVIDEIESELSYILGAE